MNYRNLIIPGLFWASVSYNMGTIAFTTKQIGESLDIGKFYVGSLMSITLIGWFFGSLIFGHLSDKYGRKKMIVIATPLHILATSLMFFANSYFMFLLLRFIAGFGFGIILPVLSTIVSENSPIMIRGRMVVLLDSFWTYGWIAASLASLFLPSLGSNWKIYYVFSLFWLFLIPMGKYLEESRIFKRSEEKIYGILKIKYYPIYIIWGVMALSYYGMFSWLPKIFLQNYESYGYTLVFISMLFQVPGYFTSAYLIEKIGRRIVLFLFMVMSGITAYFFIIGISLLPAILLSFFDLGAWGAMYAYTPEIFPRKLRGKGTGMASSMGRIGGIIGPLIPGFFNFLISFSIFTLSLIFSSFLVFLLPETMRKELT